MKKRLFDINLKSLKSKKPLVVVSLKENGLIDKYFYFSGGKKLDLSEFLRLFEDLEYSTLYIKNIASLAYEDFYYNYIKEGDFDSAIKVTLDNFIGKYPYNVVFYLNGYLYTY